MRALVVSNMLPDEAHPERGRFVRDQVAALRELGGELEVELYEFAPGARALAGAVARLRRHARGERFDVVHAHFGLTAWPALAVAARVRALTVHGTDLGHPRTRMLTRMALPTVDLLAAASPSLIEQIPGRRSRARARVLSCGVQMERFGRVPRAEARGMVGVVGTEPCLLFPADPARAEKRHDRALALAQEAGARLLTLGGVQPDRVKLYVNAANAVIVPSEREGFGLVALEALACDVPVLATPVGIHPKALAGVHGCLCEPFEQGRWLTALAPHLAAPDPRVAGRARAEEFSARRMAERVAEAWRTFIADAG